MQGCKRAHRAALAGLLAPLLALGGCAGDAEKIRAIQAVNQAFRTDYEKIILSKGSRSYRQRRDDVFVAMRVAMAGLGLRTESQDASLGHLVVVGPAPLPLDAQEWRQASSADLPLLRAVIAPHVGSLPASLVQFEPQGLEVLIDATFIEADAATEVLMTVHLRETAPPRSGWPRREYLSPTVVQAGLDKLWGALERELRAGPQRR